LQFCSLQIFHEPTQAEQKAKVPTTTSEQARTVLVERKEFDEAAATAASIVDAAVNSPTKEEEHSSDEAEPEAVLVSDPTVGAYESDGQGETISI
jgi:hypothetical protein